jgi:acetyl-CoA carboxylase biotin carboxyl carrier protein
MATTIKAHITGTVWKVEAKAGDQLAEGDAIVILESMKMEIPVEAPEAGRVVEVKVAEGQAVKEGDPLAIFQPEE